MWLPLVLQLKDQCHLRSYLFQQHHEWLCNSRYSRCGRRNRCDDCNVVSTPRLPCRECFLWGPSPLIFLSTRAAIETKNESKVCTLFNGAQATNWNCPRSMPNSQHLKPSLTSSNVKVYWVSIAGWSLVYSVSLLPMGRSSFSINLS